MNYLLNGNKTVGSLPTRTMFSTYVIRVQSENEYYGSFIADTKQSQILRLLYSMALCVIHLIIGVHVKTVSCDNVVSQYDDVLTDLEYLKGPYT